MFIWLEAISPWSGPSTSSNRSCWSPARAAERAGALSKRHLKATDALVLEATSNAWTTYDLLAPLGGRCVVANPLQVHWIAQARVKTDNQDTMRLARLLAANLITEVWVPPVPVRGLRALIAHRSALVRSQTRAKNRLHSVLHRQQLTPPPGDLFAAHHQRPGGRP
jgi:transposase